MEVERINSYVLSFEIGQCLQLQKCGLEFILLQIKYLRSQTRFIKFWRQSLIDFQIDDGS